MFRGTCQIFEHFSNKWLKSCYDNFCGQNFAFITDVKCNKEQGKGWWHIPINNRRSEETYQFFGVAQTRGQNFNSRGTSNFNMKWRCLSACYLSWSKLIGWLTPANAMCIMLQQVAVWIDSFEIALGKLCVASLRAAVTTVGKNCCSEGSNT